MMRNRNNESLRVQNEQKNQQRENEPTSRFGRILKRFGIAGFLFFFLKGVILWILVPLGLFRWLGGCE